MNRHVYQLTTALLSAFTAEDERDACRTNETVRRANLRACYVGDVDARHGAVRIPSIFGDFTAAW